MTQGEFRERKQKAKKCLYCIDFFGFNLCFFRADKNTVQEDPFKIKAPMCLDLKKCPHEEFLKNMRNEIKENKSMAKDFSKAASSKKFVEVGKASAEKAQVITVKMIPNIHIHNYPFNREDISDTTDLENSIRQIGFIDPVVLTSRTTYDNLEKQNVLLKEKLEEDLSEEELARIKDTINKIDVVLSELGSNEEYMLVSGHRRRFAGVKVGLDDFPSIIREFNTIEEIDNYVLLANSQRDSAKDPLLFCRRYKMHEEYLKSIGFKGNIRDEIATRLGISKSHADRFNTMNKIIFPVWDMVRDETVGMSSVMPMASHNESEQLEIYNIMQEALTAGVSLTRDTVKLIVDEYRAGKKDWASIVNKTPENNLPLNASEFEEQLEGQTAFEEYEENTEVEMTSDEVPSENNPANLDKEIKVVKAKDITRLLKKLDDCFMNEFEFKSEHEAFEIMENIKITFENILSGMCEIASEHQLKEDFKKLILDIKYQIEDYQYQ